MFLLVAWLGSNVFLPFFSVLKHAHSFSQPRQRCGKFEDENGVELLKGQMRLGLDVFLPDGMQYIKVAISES